MKRLISGKTYKRRNVVPYIGTWIETEGKSLDTVFGYVVPYIGTWIETLNIEGTSARQTSYLI